MAIDWDACVLAPVMAVFGDGDPSDPESWPLYQPKTGDPFRVQSAVFDDAYLGVAILGDGLPSMQTINPVLGVRLALFASPPISGDRVTVPSVGKSFFVNEVKADGHGWAKLELTVSA